MGKRALDHWDRNAPLDQAQPAPLRLGRGQAAWCWTAFDAAGAGLRRHAPRRFFDQPWIDARPRPGKQSGAYSHPVTADRHPYVFMNYMGERRDVLTLAHELGHAVHQTLAAPLGTLLADTPADPGRDRLDLRRGPGVRAPAGRRVQGRAPGPAGRQDRGRPQHRGAPDRLPPLRDAASTPRGRRASCRPSRSAALWLEVMGESLGPAVQAQPRLRALLGLRQPLRARAVLRLRLRLREPAGRGADGEAAARTPRASRRSTRTCSPPAAPGPTSRRWRPSASTRARRPSGRRAASGWSGWWTSSRR